MSGSDEKSSKPENNITTNPPSVNSQVLLASSAALPPRNPMPSIEKSTMAMVPMENANPTMWMHSRIGKASSDELRGLVISTFDCDAQSPLRRGDEQALHRSQVYQSFR